MLVNCHDVQPMHPQTHVAGNLRPLRILHRFLDPADHAGVVSRVVKSVLLTSIFGSVFAAVTATLPDISSDARLWLGRLSIVTFFIFLVEYLARAVSAPGRDPAAEQAPAKAVLEYVRSPLGIVDAIVVLLQLGHAVGWFGPVVARLGAVPGDR